MLAVKIKVENGVATPKVVSDKVTPIDIALMLYQIDLFKKQLLEVDTTPKKVEEPVVAKPVQVEVPKPVPEPVKEKPKSIMESLTDDDDWL